MLQVNTIRLSYGPRLILDDVSFTVAPGEKAGLIGVNGAGKSSLLKIIAVSVSYASGNAGGIFGPSLFIGAMVGAGVGGLAHLAFPGSTAGPGGRRTRAGRAVRPRR